MKNKWKVVSSGPWVLPGWARPLIEAGCEVVEGRTIESHPERTYDEDELIRLYEGADAVIASSRDLISRKVLESCARLKIVAKSSVGVDLIDLDAAAELGILVVNSPARENIIGVAEATIGFMMALSKNLFGNQRLLREGDWKRSEHLGTMFAGKTVGIVGLGRIGMNVARRLTGWDVRLLAADPYVDPDMAYAVGAQLVGLEELMRTSDVVTLHLVLNERTHHLINEKSLHWMKPDSILVNTARGGLVDAKALARALREDRIAGAALDVYEVEPLPMSSELREIDPTKLIMTPHSIGTNIAMQATGTRLAVENILRVMRGEFPRYLLNEPASISKSWRFQNEALRD